MFSSEIYELSDCHLYDDATTDKSSTYTYTGLTVTNNGSEYSVQCNTADSILNFINNINNVSCELKIKFNNANTGLMVSTNGAFNNQGYGELFYYATSSSKIYHYYNNRGSLTSVLNINKSLSSSEWYTMKVTIENNNYVFSIVDSNGSVVQTSSHTISTIQNNMFGLFNTRVGYSCYIKDIKVKAL